MLCCGTAVGGGKKGFAVGYAHSASLICQLNAGPRLRFADYLNLDRDMTFLGTRNFFVAMRIYGKDYACADAVSVYGPDGVIRTGYLEE